MIKLTVQLFRRVEVTTHANEAETFARLGVICSTQSLRLERMDSLGEGQFHPQVFVAGRSLDDPAVTWNYGGYLIEEIPTGGGSAAEHGGE